MANCVSNQQNSLLLTSSNYKILAGVVASAIIGIGIISLLASQGPLPSLLKPLQVLGSMGKTGSIAMIIAGTSLGGLPWCLKLHVAKSPNRDSSTKASLISTTPKPIVEPSLQQDPVPLATPVESSNLTLDSSSQVTPSSPIQSASIIPESIIEPSLQQDPVPLPTPAEPSNLTLDSSQVTPSSPIQSASIIPESITELSLQQDPVPLPTPVESSNLTLDSSSLVTPSSPIQSASSSKITSPETSDMLSRITPYTICCLKRLRNKESITNKQKNKCFIIEEKGTYTFLFYSTSSYKEIIVKNRHDKFVLEAANQTYSFKNLMDFFNHCFKEGFDKDGILQKMDFFELSRPNGEPPLTYVNPYFHVTYRHLDFSTITPHNMENVLKVLPKGQKIGALESKLCYIKKTSTEEEYEFKFYFGKKDVRRIAVRIQNGSFEIIANKTKHKFATLKEVFDFLFREKQFRDGKSFKEIDHFQLLAKDSSYLQYNNPTRALDRNKESRDFQPGVVSYLTLNLSQLTAAKIENLFVDGTKLLKIQTKNTIEIIKQAGFYLMKFKRATSQKVIRFRIHNNAIWISDRKGKIFRVQNLQEIFEKII